ncbi:hypothetical protein Ahy_A06g029847 [Arachis hypogaea]|uniref:Aminotransferase-like plant mobile domain-containing protein n=1 Tax=Arachis hypogaea TaxID=3818 RepID=A0A445CUF4_ARAHY|nr:hypothetical protein Ahy_A06g029847 [Arachis hypogaea]
MFSLPWGEATITLQDVAYHLELRAHREPVGGVSVVRHGDTGIGGAAARCQASGDSTAGGTEEKVVLAEAYMAAGPCLPYATDGLSRDTLTVCEVLHLVTDRGIPDDEQYFERCRGLSWGSAVLAWTYHSLCSTTHQGTTDIAGCSPLLISWIYQKFLQWCLPDRQLFMYHMAARDPHEARALRWRLLIDQLRWDKFVWMLYDDPTLQALCPLSSFLSTSTSSSFTKLTG